MEFNNKIYRAPSIPKISSKNISSSVLRTSSAISSSSTIAPTLKTSRIRFGKSQISSQADKISQTPEEQKDITSSLTETNRILIEIQKQLSLDFAMRIAEEQDNLNKIKSARRKQKISAEENRLESGVKKVSSFGEGVVKRISAPIASVFDRIKQFFTLLAANLLANEGFKWLQDENNRILLGNIFNWIGKAFIPALITILALKVFKWARRLFKLGRFLIRLPGRIFKLTKKVFSKTFRLLKQASLKVLGKGGFRSVAKFFTSLGKKGKNFLKGISEATTKKLIKPFVDIALPLVPPKVRAKIATKIGGKGIARFIPFVNTVIAVPDVISSITKGDYEGALLAAAGAIPVAGWAALALDIYREVDPEGYSKNIRGGLSKEAMNKSIVEGLTAMGEAQAGGLGTYGYSKGGTVKGVGNKDTVPAMLTPGEEVINAKASSLHRPILKDINNNYGELWGGFTNTISNLNETTQYQLNVSEKYGTVLDQLKNLFTTDPSPSESEPPGPAPATITPPKEKDDDSKAKITPQQPSSRNIGMPEKPKKKINFLDMKLPDNTDMGKMPEAEATATDVNVISPINPSNPFMSLTPSLYGIYM